MICRRFCAGLALCLGLWAQQVLNNEAIVKMVKMGFGDDVIVSVIEKQPGNFDLTADGLIALKQAGVGDKTISAMLKKTGSPASVAAAPAASAFPNEVGVYSKNGNSWAEVMPEVVNWKTGGVVKSLSTAGVVKGDINGLVQGGQSKTRLKEPIEILVFTPEGTAITEYQLIRFRPKEDRREFRTVTGGVFHVSGGSQRDIVPFEGKKVASRTWVVDLSKLTGGEYGILSPGANTAQHASAQLGKIYTFKILE